MDKEKLKDAWESVKDQGISALAESDLLPAAIENVTETVLPEAASQILSSVVGFAAPRVTGAVMGYREARFERRTKEAIEVLIRRIDDLEIQLATLSKETTEKFQGLYVEWLLDNIGDEKQPEKVEYNVNAFINLMNDEANDNLMLMFFQTINELTVLDIEVLKLYVMGTEDNIYTLCDRNHLEVEQVSVIKEKLARLGMLHRKNDDIRDDNIDLITKYLEDVEKDNKRRTPKGVKAPKTKKPSRSETYSITSLGRHFLNVISSNE